MALNHSKVKVEVISECFVKPKYEVQESQKPHYLIGTDLTLLLYSYIKKGFVYKKPKTNDFNINSFVENMKDSLSHTLVYYYPLAGRLTTVKYEDDHACSIHVDCNKGPGARFIHASCLNVTVYNDIFDHHSFFDLGETGVINHDGHTRALVSLQVTEMDDGIAIGVSMNHSLGDDTSFMNFVSSLSEIFLSKNDNKMNVSLSHMPIFEPYIPDGCSLIQKLPYLEPEEFIIRMDKDPRLCERTFRFSSSSIARLKERANSELGSAPGKISSFQALAALVWISINRARKIPCQEMSSCFMPMDCRTRLRPALSPLHFGNQAQLMVVTKNVGELLENGLGWASMVLNQGLLDYNIQVMAHFLKTAMENPSILRPDDMEKKAEKMNLVNFSWASKFDVYGVDFGLGKAVTTPSSNDDNGDGTVFVTAGHEGGGQGRTQEFGKGGAH